MDTGSIDLRNTQTIIADRVWTWDSNHQIIYGDSLDLSHLTTLQYDLAFIEPPGVSETTTIAECSSFFGFFFAALDNVMRDDSAICLLPRDRKGHFFFKSAIAVMKAQDFRWQAFRHYAWKWTEADFHRASYCFHDLYIFRRGNMPTQNESEWRWKDIVEYRRPKSSDQYVQEVPQELVEGFVHLFWDGKSDCSILDPFAGSGCTIKAAKKLGIRSTSIELYRPRYDALVKEFCSD